MIQVSEVNTGADQARMDERERAAYRRGEQEHQHRERPRNEEQHAHIERRNTRSLYTAYEGVDCSCGAAGLNEKDAGDLAARRTIEHVQVCPLKPMKQRVPELYRNASLKSGRQQLRCIG